MKTANTILVSCVTALTLTSCHLFESTKVPAKEIKTASSWSEKDQAPSFPDCQEIDDATEKQNCFESIISYAIMDYIDQNPWESSEYFEEEIILNLHIDKEGYFSLKEVERSNAIVAAIPNLEESLEIAVSQIPQAEPGLKSNVGAMVATKLKLPIMISAQ